VENLGTIAFGVVLAGGVFLGAVSNIDRPPRVVRIFQTITAWTVVVGIAALVFSFVGDVGDQSDEINVTLTEDFNEVDKTIIIGAVQILSIQCPAITKYATDFVKSEADFNEFYSRNAGFDKTRGWGRLVELRLTVSGDPKSLPNEWHAAHHTLYFSMGGGRQPGVFMLKEQAARFCGFTKSRSFMDVPALRFVK